MDSTRNSSGITLIEVLVVVAIILVLAGVIASVFLTAKEQAKTVVDISNLHQLGIAASIYASDYDDNFPLSVYDLLRNGQSLKGATDSPLDTTARGLAYDFRNGMALDLWMPPANMQRVTYIGPGDGGWTWSHFQEKMADATNAGWLVNLVRAKRRGKTVQGSHGRVQRLTLEASVINRSVEARTESIDGINEQALEFKWYFGDYEP